MMIKYVLMACFCGTFLFAEAGSVDVLIEKMKQSKDPTEKRLLLEAVKQELAQMNRQARDEAQALMEAKSKQPQQPFKSLE